MTKRTTGTVCLFVVLTAAAVSANELDQPDAALNGKAIRGETLDPALYGPAISESMDEVIARDHVILHEAWKRRDLSDKKGVWATPSRRRAQSTSSGNLYVHNKWGETRMGIRFPETADVLGATIIAHAAEGAATSGIRVVGFRAGVRVAETDWFDDIDADPSWMSIDFVDVDRIEFQAQPMVDGAGWFGMDDLTYIVDGVETTLSFDDLDYRTELTESQYGGLIWEMGRGDFDAHRAMPRPQIPADVELPVKGDDDPPPASRAATAPTLDFDFTAVVLGEEGSYSFPPDTHGAIGPSHYVSVVNSNFEVYNRETGAEIASSSLEAFFPAMNPGGGDPRVIFDQWSQRWIIIATDFDYGAEKIHLAVSYTSSPTFPGFYKTSFTPQGGADAGTWVDYPTLGVDENGIYIGAFMVGNSMTIFAIDKAPLVSGSPSLGTITAWRSLQWEGALQPAHTYDSGVGEHVVSRTSSLSQLRIRRIDPPLTAPTLTQLGFVSIGSNGVAPNAPALGSTTVVDTGGDARLMMSVFRNGCLWTTHCISQSGRAAVDWYQVDVNPLSLVQSGTIYDSGMYYYYPSLMVNSNDDMVIGFSGSNATQFIGAYYAGRKGTDPLGETSAPVQYRAGSAPYTAVFNGQNRWGDYSYVTLDPTDDTAFFCIQEYAHATNTWGTSVAKLLYSAGPTPCPGDANCDGQIDFGDINAFVDALLNSIYCDGTGTNADVDEGGSVGFEDINPFVDLLTQNPLPIACP